MRNGNNKDHHNNYYVNDIMYFFSVYPLFLHE
jgi:hypothetical protein